RNPNPYPVVLMERVDATVHITPCSSNMAPDAPIMVNHRGAQHQHSPLPHPPAAAAHRRSALRWPEPAERRDVRAHEMRDEPAICGTWLGL
ncbi:MAG: hypothetical protein ACYDEY_04320, partial [Acidimicrobiales bacterium]